MRLPIDTSRLQFLVAAEADPLRQWEEGKPREQWGPKVDKNGEVMYDIRLVALGDGDADIIKVSVPGDPNVKQGEMVRIEGMTANAWEKDGKSGTSFQAQAIRAGSASARAEKQAA